MSSPEPAESLLAAMQEWARHALPAPPSGHGGPECQWCPLCQLASVLRGEHPEITERLAEAGEAISGAVRALVESANAAMPSPGRPSAGVPSPGEPIARRRRRPQPRVQRIVLDDDAAAD